MGLICPAPELPPHLSGMLQVPGCAPRLAGTSQGRLVQLTSCLWFSPLNPGGSGCTQGRRCRGEGAGALLGLCNAELWVRWFQDPPQGAVRVGRDQGKSIQCLDEAGSALGTHQVPPCWILESSRCGGCTTPLAPGPAASPPGEKHFLMSLLALPHSTLSHHSVLKILALFPQ